MAWTTRGTSDAQVGQAPAPGVSRRCPAMRARLLSLLLRPTPPPAVLGLVVAASFIVAESLLVLLLKYVAPGSLFGAIFLLGVMVVAIGWGFGLTAATSLASALAFDYFRNWPADFVLTEPQNWLAIAIFLVVGLSANTPAVLARSGAVEADQRRVEAEASRDELGVLAEQQAALRRLATLVARGVSPSEVFSTVTGELTRVLGVSNSGLFRYEPDGASILIARNPPALRMPVGERFSLEGENVAAMVLRTGRIARMDSHQNALGSLAALIRELGIRCGVGAPIVVNGRMWGAAIIGSTRPEPLPPETEPRLADFADLVATAIANAQTRADLTASRARIVAAGDEARRRFERDLHDGAQQRLVSLGLTLRAAEALVLPEQQALREQISGAIIGLTGVSEDVREISRGIRPAILSKGGLGPALQTLARRSTLPVDLELRVDRRFPECAEVAAYYVVAEALTNATKYARASEVNVCVEADGANLRLWIRDNGIGGAHAGKGSGLIGLIDRVEALGGHMEISSHHGKGTSLLVKIPFED
jgi:signal transduction histidine kinase